MKFLILDSHDPYLNLAIEQYLFENCDDDVFMLWQNEPCVVIGKNQNAYTEINFDLLNEKGVKVVRRITGGGAVYHDFGNLNYTFISDKRSEGIDFAYFTAPIIEALSSFGIDACLSGRNDILVDGKKISGNAQHTSGTRVLHHGTLLFDSELDFLSSLLKVDEEKIKSKAIKSTRSRVTNIKPLLSSEMTVAQFVESLSNFVIKKYSPELIEAPVCEKIALLRARNASEEWIFPDKAYLSGYSITRKKKYPYGLVTIFLNMKNDIITDVKIRGDFFGSSPIERLEDAIRKKCISNIGKIVLNVGDFIFGMTNDELLSLIRNGD